MTVTDAPSRLRATLAEVGDTDRLAAAWDEVLASDLHDGILGAGVARFAQDADQNLASITAELIAGDYHPGWLTPVSLPRPDGQIRLLHIPTVRDRIVERSALGVVTPVIDPWLGPFSYAYRPGLGIADAAQEVARLRDEGLIWVARADFHDCFGTIPVPLLRRELRALISDTALITLIEEFLERRPASRPGIRSELRGLPQGSPLSPLWANLVLFRFDARVATAGFPLVRYSDDIVALAASLDEAWEAMRVMSDAADEIGMTLGAEKSAVMSFEEGFCFIGEDFGPRYPPVLADHRVTKPSRRIVYLAMQGAHARLDADRLVVDSPDDTEVVNVPSGLVERLVSFGAIGSAPASGHGHWRQTSIWYSSPGAAPISATPGPQPADGASPGSVPS